MADKMPQKPQQTKYFYCEYCDYSCTKLFLYKQHCGTKKHNTLYTTINKTNADIGLYRCSCGKNYKHIQSFNRHVKNCGNEIVLVGKDGTHDKEKDELREIITTLITQNQNMLLENKEMREMVTEMIPKIGNNNTTIQNKFNLQIFLNEKCKDAINLTDFVNTLELKMDDLDNTRQHGFITGITDIFVKGLKQLALNKRPIHCSDLKREVLYVKDNDTWERDNDKNNMKQAINNMAKKQIDKIKEWECEHPDWNKTEKGTTEYIEMIRNVTNTGSEDYSENKIIKTIAKEVLIDKL